MTLSHVDPVVSIHSSVGVDEVRSDPSLGATGPMRMLLSQGFARKMTCGGWPLLVTTWFLSGAVVMSLEASCRAHHVKENGAV